MELHVSLSHLGKCKTAPYLVTLLVKSTYLKCLCNSHQWIWLNKLHIVCTGNHLLHKATERFWKGMFSLSNDQIQPIFSTCSVSHFLPVPSYAKTILFDSIHDDMNLGLFKKQGKLETYNPSLLQDVWRTFTNVQALLQLHLKLLLFLPILMKLVLMLAYSLNRSHSQTYLLMALA